MKSETKFQPGDRIIFGVNKYPDDCPERIGDRGVVIGDSEDENRVMVLFDEDGGYNNPRDPVIEYLEFEHIYDSPLYKALT